MTAPAGQPPASPSGPVSASGPSPAPRSHPAVGGRPRLRARARSREDKAGDPLDGLVNLFDLGIVLSVAFLLAALSSLDLDAEILRRGSRPAAQQEQRQTAPAGSVVIDRDATVRRVEIRADQRVVGRGRAIGTVYQLEDGRTIVVREPDARAGAP